MKLINKLVINSIHKMDSQEKRKVFVGDVQYDAIYEHGILMIQNIPFKCHNGEWIGECIAHTGWEIPFDSKSIVEATAKPERLGLDGQYTQYYIARFKLRITFPQKRNREY